MRANEDECVQAKIGNKSEGECIQVEKNAYKWLKLALTSMSRRFLQRRYDTRGGEENASKGIVVKKSGNDLRCIR